MAFKRKAQIRMTGIKEFDDKLKQMERKASNRIATQVLKAGARKAVKAIQNVSPEWMKDGIGSNVGTNKRKDVFEAKIGINVGKRSKKKAKADWAAAQVLGTVKRTRKTIGGKFSYITRPSESQLSTGQEKAKGVVKQGMTAAQSTIQAAMKDKFNKALAKEVAKAKLKGK
jgi:hypothetical protein